MMVTRHPPRQNRARAANAQGSTLGFWRQSAHPGNLEGETARVVAVRRFETPAGRQPQVDRGRLGGIVPCMPEAVFGELGGAPEEIVYHRMKTVWQAASES
jgi:transposase